jgi:hypothetical protein
MTPRPEAKARIAGAPGRERYGNSIEDFYRAVFYAMLEIGDSIAIPLMQNVY